MARNSLIIILFLLSQLLQAQVNRYAVFFSDKDGTPYSIDQPEAFLSTQSIERRQQQGIAIQENDLPVNPEYIMGIEDAGAEVFYTSKWFNLAIVQMQDELTLNLLDLAYVSEIRLIATDERLVSPGRKKSSWLSRIKSRSTDSQLSQLGINNLHDEGFFGDGILVAVFDSGFEGVNTTSPFSAIFAEDRLIDSFNFVLNSDNVFDLDDHGTEVLSVISAELEDDFLGAAPRSSFVLYLTEDDFSEFPIEEFNWLVAAERADSVGVDIINSSLGYNTFDSPFDDYSPEDMDGNTTVISRAADLAVSKGMLVVTSAGNEGNNSWGIITAPADADSVLSVGSVNVQGILSSSSSNGPTADGRLKPEVVALGASTSVINSQGNLDVSGGTSFSAPLITGMAACIWESKPDLTAMQLRDTIISIGDNFDTPNNQYGNGIPRYGDILITSLETAVGSSIKAFPNPTSSNAITVSGIKYNRPKFVLVDANGNKSALNSQNSDKGSYIIDLGKIASGAYFVEIDLGTKTKTIKVLKR
ncbi:MAG: S8 family serine peptidase [Bacteroidota bacterium]